jgi:hypothetical protein
LPLNLSKLNPNDTIGHYQNQGNNHQKSQTQSEFKEKNKDASKNKGFKPKKTNKLTTFQGSNSRQ